MGDDHGVESGVISNVPCPFEGTPSVSQTPKLQMSVLQY